MILFQALSPWQEAKVQVEAFIKHGIIAETWDIADALEPNLEGNVTYSRQFISDIPFLDMLTETAEEEEVHFP